MFKQTSLMSPVNAKHEAQWLMFQTWRVGETKTLCESFTESTYWCTHLSIQNDAQIWALQKHLNISTPATQTQRQGCHEFSKFEL